MACMKINFVRVRLHGTVNLSSDGDLSFVVVTIIFLHLHCLQLKKLQSVPWLLQMVDCV